MTCTAYAEIFGGPLAPHLRGIVKFLPAAGGTWVDAEIWGLPPYQAAQGMENPIGPTVFIFMSKAIAVVTRPILSSCRRALESYHSLMVTMQDFPFVFQQWHTHMEFFIDKFYPFQVIGKAVIIHQNPDDYRSQPAGNAGKRLACGIIVQG